MSKAGLVRRIYQLQGVVQGVGFRPGVHRLASRFGLGGSVQNLGDRVQVVLEGCVEEINSFMAALPQELPRLARIERCELVQEIPIFQALGQFYVEESRDSDSREIVFPADVAVCASCRREVLDPADRRYRYAFTTCTECGPRYTVINDTPYDRERTTLHAFPFARTVNENIEIPWVGDFTQKV